MSALTGGTGAVTLNVGGTVYMTTHATLTRVEGSMLGALAEASLQATTRCCTSTATDHPSDMS